MSSEASGLERVLGTINMVCGGLIFGRAIIDLYRFVAGMGWSDDPATNRYHFQLLNMLPWYTWALMLSLLLRFVVSFSFVSAGLSLKQNLEWSMKACVIVAALVIVLGFADLAYTILAVNPAAERAMLASNNGVIPAGSTRADLDMYIILGTLPFMIFVIVQIVLLRLHRS